MSYIEPEVIEQARQIDLLTYLQAFEPGELVKISSNNYTTRTHDSLKISNGKWMWWAKGFGGHNALDYLIKVKEYSFVEAVATLMGKAAVQPSVTVQKPKNERPKVLLLPDKSASIDRITEYLFGRGIDYSIIDYCISHGLIFESLPYHNLVFVGFDNSQKPKYAAYRATNDTRIMGDCSGSDKHYSFRVTNEKNDELHLFECAIDLLSYATLLKMKGVDWKDQNLVSLAGVYLPKKNLADSKKPAAVTEFLNGRSDIKKIYFHFDNDIAGKKASSAMQAIFSANYEIIDSPPPKGKDFNDYLCYKLGIIRKKNDERSVER